MKKEKIYFMGADKYFDTRHLESDWCCNDINKNNVNKII